MWKVFQKKVPETAQALTLAAAERIFYSLQPARKRRIRKKVGEKESREDFKKENRKSI